MVKMLLSSRNFGRREKSFVREQSELEARLAEYNAYYVDNPKSQVSAREVNGRLILEGILKVVMTTVNMMMMWMTVNKVYWGTEASVRLKEFDDTRLSSNMRQMKTMSVGPDFMAPGNVGTIWISKESLKLFYFKQFMI